MSFFKQYVLLCWLGMPFYIIQLQKLKAAERGIEKKEKEIKSLQEHLSNKELECGHLRDELRSVRNAELSPTASMEDISQSVGG